MRPSDKPTFFEGESVRLSRKLSDTIEEKDIYDDVGHAAYGWHAYVIKDKVHYIVSQVGGIFGFKEYSGAPAARKAWDHLCNKFEDWYTERYAEQSST
jgi:hypothetical protein